LTTIHVNIGFVTPKQRSRTERSFRGLTPEQRKQDRYEKLVAAARKEFAERGVHAATVREICRTAQLTERYFYESFSNLPALFMVVFERANVQLQKEMLAALAGAAREPLELTGAALRLYLEFLRADPTRAKILLIESVAGDRVVLGAASQRQKMYVVLLRGYAQFLFPWLANPKLELRLDIVCNGLVGATNYIAYDWVKEDFTTPLENVLQSALALYRGVILHARELEPKPVDTAPARGRPEQKRGQVSKKRARR
jgi:AcrR family transcriptional regulator